MSRPCFGLPSVRKTCPVRQWIEPEMYRFSLLPGVSTLACSPLYHPHRADLGVGVDVHLVLEHRRLVGGQPGQELAEGVELGLAFGVLRAEHRTRAAIDQVAAMQPAADGLAADLDLVDLEHQQGDGLAAPPAAEEAEVARGVLGDPLDGDGDPLGGEAKGSAGLDARPPPRRPRRGIA